MITTGEIWTVTLQPASISLWQQHGALRKSGWSDAQYVSGTYSWRVNTRGRCVPLDIWPVGPSLCVRVRVSVCVLLFYRDIERMGGPVRLVQPVEECCSVGDVSVGGYRALTDVRTHLKYMSSCWTSCSLACEVEVEGWGGWGCRDVDFLTGAVGLTGTLCLSSCPSRGSFILTPNPHMMRPQRSDRPHLVGWSS